MIVVTPEAISVKKYPYKESNVTALKIVIIMNNVGCTYIYGLKSSQNKKSYLIRIGKARFRFLKVCNNIRTSQMTGRWMQINYNSRLQAQRPLRTRTKHFQLSNLLI